MSEKIKEYDEDGRVIRENRTQSKRERQEIKDLAENLLKLPHHQYERLPISQTFHDALIEGGRLTGNAYQRHLTFMTRLLNDLDYKKIGEIFENINNPNLNQNPKKTVVEDFINRLLTNDKTVFPEILTYYGDVDLQYLRQLGREMQKEQKKLDKAALEQDKKAGNNKYKIRLYQYLFNLKCAN